MEVLLGRVLALSRLSSLSLLSVASYIHTHIRLFYSSSYIQHDATFVNRYLPSLSLLCLSGASRVLLSSFLHYILVFFSFARGLIITNNPREEERDLCKCAGTACLLYFSRHTCARAYIYPAFCDEPRCALIYVSGLPLNYSPSLSLLRTKRASIRQRERETLIHNSLARQTNSIPLCTRRPSYFIYIRAQSLCCVAGFVGLLKFITAAGSSSRRVIS